MCQELREARLMDVDNNQVTIEKLDPGRFAERLDPSRPVQPDPPDPPFDAYADEFMVSVRYARDQDKLVRTLQRPGQEPVGVTLITGLTDMTVDDSGSLLKIRLVYKTETKRHEIEYLVEKP
jgi:hypothetical protein